VLLVSSRQVPVPVSGLILLQYAASYGFMFYSEHKDGKTYSISTKKVVAASSGFVFWLYQQMGKDILVERKGFSY
jgi:hypothetical protein